MESGLLKSIQNKNKNKHPEREDEFSENVITKEEFWSAIRVYIEKPHVVNKKICGFQPLWLGTRDGHLNSLELIDKISNILHSKNSQNCEPLQLLKNVLIEADFSCTESNTILREDVNSGVNVAFIRKILPKQLLRQCIEVVVIDGELNVVTFISEATDTPTKYIPEATYSFLLKDHTIHLKNAPDFPLNTSSDKWLSDVLLPRLKKWSHQIEASNYTNASLKYINIQHYNEVYQRLKNEYGKRLVEMWNESTDPSKFVYEDIAIASYLIVLWEQEAILKSLKEKQSFVDIGCGNGLLVYLLASEGYEGYGLDIKKRKIWDTFPSYVVLKEQSFKPSDEYLFPDYDWLIGNHSDELTPWMPVIAAKSSLTTRYFVIPCCAHDFQSKFVRMKSGVSQYAEYLDYVEKIGQICGFEVLRDKMRIPSTKRVCFIGQERTYIRDKYSFIMETIDSFVKERCKAVRSGEKLSRVPGNNEWSDNFHVREVDDRVRNCTQIKDDVKKELLQVVCSLLLKEENMIDIDNGEKKFVWNEGVKVEISTIAKTFSAKQRSYLKKNCGGIQTLLRNHRFIFVVERGYVHLRVPLKASEKSVPSDRLKQKFCWFFHNHPQGCTLTGEQCTFLH